MKNRRTKTRPRKRKYPAATWNEERQGIEVDDRFIPVTVTATTSAGVAALAEIHPLKNVRVRRTRTGDVMLTADASADVDLGGIGLRTVATRIKVTVPA